VKIILNLYVSLGDPKYIAGLNVGNEQGELAIKVQQQNPKVPSSTDPVLCEGVGDPGFDCVLVNVGSWTLLLLWIARRWWRTQTLIEQADNSPCNGKDGEANKEGEDKKSFQQTSHKFHKGLASLAHEDRANQKADGCIVDEDKLSVVDVKLHGLHEFSQAKIVEYDGCVAMVIPKAQHPSNQDVSPLILWPIKKIKKTITMRDIESPRCAIPNLTKAVTG